MPKGTNEALLGKSQYKKNCKSSDNVTRGGGGGFTLSLAFRGREGSDNFLSLAFGGKFFHKLDHFWPN